MALPFLALSLNLFIPQCLDYWPCLPSWPYILDCLVNCVCRYLCGAFWQIWFSTNKWLEFGRITCLRVLCYIVFVITSDHCCLLMFKRHSECKSVAIFCYCLGNCFRFSNIRRWSRDNREQVRILSGLIILPFQLHLESWLRTFGFFLWGNLTWGTIFCFFATMFVFIFFLIKCVIGHCVNSE